MRRRIVYVVVFLVAGAILFGARAYQRQTAKNGGYLGNEIVDFGEKEADVEPVQSTTAPTSQIAPEGTSQPTPQPTQKPSDEQYEKIIAHGKVKTYDTGTVVIDDSAYELYSYVDSVAKKYTTQINKLTKKLHGAAEVYVMVVPTSVGITLPDNKVAQVNSSSQKKALIKLQKKLSGKEKFVPLYSAMMQHRKEYIYFRTDHHWTSLGAYYAYQAFCESKGIAANPLDLYQKKKAKGFRGTFYMDTNENKNLREDTLVSYYPLSKRLSMKYTTANGVTAKAPVIADASKYGSGLKYCAYIAGDNPFTVIKNKEITENTSCVVVKESYGNAFVPYLADHYRTVYVIDYRYWEGHLTDFVRQKKVGDVIFINNISMTRNSFLIGKMAQIIS